MITRTRIEDGLADFLKDVGAPIVIGKVTPTPDRVVFLNVYDEQYLRDPDRANPDVWIQLRGRAAGEDPAPANDLMDNIFRLLDNKSRYRIGDIRVARSIRVVTTSTEEDSGGRNERADSYKFHLNPS
ncbi:minor capsid protein [Rhodococcus qingshengii]|uniref:phage tail terminator protein n=1 Tax=Rhodococcus qingshengii TaxID=334542 RepID=UPI0037C676DE